MAWKEGEVYRCPDGSCGCEVTVTKAGNPGECGNHAPVCCCGKPMKKVN
ncbi:MAG: hypothetical protein P8Z30_00160 [Acidobacteriota bacterium]